MRSRSGKPEQYIGVDAVPPAKESGTRLKDGLDIIDMSVFSPAQVEDVKRIVGESYLLYLEFAAFQKSMGDIGVATVLAFESIYRESMMRGPEAVLFDLALIKGYLEIMRRNAAGFEIRILPIVHKLASSYHNWSFSDLDTLFKKVLYAINSVYLVRMQREFMEKEWSNYGEFLLFWGNIELLMKEFSRKDGFDYLKQLLGNGLN